MKNSFLKGIGMAIAISFLTSAGAIAEPEGPPPRPMPAPRPAPQPRPQPIPQPRPQPFPQPRPQPIPQPRPQPIPQPRPQPIPQPRPQPIPQPRPQPIPQPQPQPHPFPQPEPHPQPQPQPHPQPEPHPQPQPQPHPQPEPHPQPQPQPHPQPEPHPQPQPQPHPQPEPHPQPQPQPHPQPEPHPQPQPQPHPQPEPHPQPQPQPHPAPHPHPQPVTPPTHPISPPKPPPQTPPFKPGQHIGVDPHRPVNVVQPPKSQTFTKPSWLSNQYTKGNNKQAWDKLNAFNNAHPSVAHQARLISDQYKTSYDSVWRSRFKTYYNYCHDDHYRYYYGAWFPYGFCGGYYYPIVPCDDIYDYFYYPMVMWFYVDTVEVDYYQYYYTDYDPSNPVQPFPYARDYFPTDTLRDLAVEVSGMSYEQQQMFRAALVNFTDWAQDAISAQLQATFQFGDNDIVVNHYENLQDQAIEIEGFVDRDDLHAGFKGLLDLTDPTQTMVFVPLGDTPTPDQLATLQAINDRITQLGGDPLVIDNEPDNVPPPASNDDNGSDQ